MPSDTNGHDDDIIDVTPTAVTVRREPNEVWQATLKPQTDHKLLNVENIQVKLFGRPTKDDAWDLLVPYLVRKVNRSEVRQIFEAALHGKKPLHRKTGDKFRFEFQNTDGQFIEAYELTFIRL